MSGIIHKVKDALSGGHDTAHDSTTHNTSSTHRAGATGTTGYHDTAGVHRSDVGNKVDPRVDSDRDGHSGLTGKGTTGGYGSHTTSGPHSSDAANKLDPRVDSDRDESRGIGGGYSGAGTLGGAGTHNTHTTAGPHRSDAGNKLDPRVDSDRDGRSAFSSGAGPLGGTTGIHSVNDTYGRHDTHPNTHNTNPIVLNSGSGVGGLGSSHHTTAGPHSSDAANKIDPRIDSDRDGRGVGHGTTGAGLGSTHGATTGNGLGHSHHTTAGSHHTTSGPHSSDAANKADPRVDSDRDGRGLSHGTNAYGPTGHALGGSHHNAPGIDSGHDGRGSNAYGDSVGINDRRAHNQVGHMETIHTKGSSAAHGGTSHRADPRFDATTGSTTHHSASDVGPAPNTAGPHKSDLLNKLDPRVDSNLDGSKTAGGNKTFDTTGSTRTSGHQFRDTSDASQVPPSQFQKEYGSATMGSKQGGAL